MKKYFCRALLGIIAIIPMLAFAIGVDSRQSRLTLAASSGRRNCIKSLDMTMGPANSGTLRILSAGTTVYTVVISSGGGILRDWDDLRAPCDTDVNKTMEVYVAVDDGSSNFWLNTYSFYK